MSAASSENLFDGTQRQRKRNKAQSNVQLNPAISPPYLQKWPEIQKQHQKMILEEFNDVFEEKIADLWLVNKMARITKDHPERSGEKNEERLRRIISKEEKYMGKDVEKLLSSLNDPGKIKSMKNLKEFVMIGTRDLSRCKEKNIDLHLVICCNSGDEWVCQNLLCESLLSNIPVCSINGLSDILSLCLGVNRARAIAFKKVENNPFSDLVEFIIDKIPNVSSPWCKLWGEEGTYGKKVKLCSDKEVVDSTDKARDEDTTSCATCSKEGDTATSSNGTESTIKQEFKEEYIPSNEADDCVIKNELINDTEYLEMNIMWKEKGTERYRKIQKGKDTSQTPGT